MNGSSFDWQLSETDDALQQLLVQHAQCEAVVVDTEFMRRDTFFPRAALIQLCFVGSNTAWLLDPLRIADFTPLKKLFADTAVVKIIHSPSEDLEVFQHFLGTLPEPLFDTQRAAAFLNLGFGLGYRALVEQMSGLEIPKGETRSNWLARPLSEAQLAYAAQDVIPLAPIYSEMMRQLQRSGRLEWLLEDGAQAVAAARGEGAPAYHRIKSAWKLNRLQLAALAALCDWREQRARQLDKPRNWILQDKVCLQIAEQGPRNLDDLLRIQDLPAATLRKQGERLLEVLSSDLQGERPAPLPRPLSAAQRETLKALKQAARELAANWELAAEVLLPAKDYELMVRLGAGEELSRPAHWDGWRAQRLIEPLLQLSTQRAQ
ncbi:MAG: ribonuclease D [Gammaproteobacteria bacterium]|nr:ribonuclease D [Gammaproteobacteria bacterium]